MKNSDNHAGSAAPADGPVESPCRRQCCLDDQDICLGCGRSLAEILEWGSASNARRREICTAAQGRVRKSWNPSI